MKEYVGTMEAIPQVGKSAIIERLNNGQIEKVKSTEISNIVRVTTTIFKIETENSIYVVKVTI